MQADRKPLEVGLWDFGEPSYRQYSPQEVLKALRPDIGNSNPVSSRAHLKAAAFLVAR